jgi:hypothetical protein
VREAEAEVLVCDVVEEVIAVIAVVTVVEGVAVVEDSSDLARTIKEKVDGYPLQNWDALSRNDTSKPWRRFICFLSPSRNIRSLITCFPTKS